jgi:dienelactone hydrolase
MPRSVIAAVAALALAAIAWSVLHLESARDGVRIEQRHVGAIPVTVFTPVSHEASGELPVVVIAHGFAGSQQLMQPFALTLARNGYLAVSFDFPGHGRHPVPLPGSLREHDALLAALLGAIDAVVAGTRSLPAAGSRVALLGHSMASDLVVRHAQAHPDIVATVGVSLVYGGAQPLAPRNLLALYGSLEPDAVQAFGRQMVAGSAEAAIAGQTLGSFADGSARRYALAPGAEHISVLYHSSSLREALLWLDQAFGRGTRTDADPAAAGARVPAAFIAARGPALGVLFAGILALGWALAAALGRVGSDQRARLSASGRRSRHGRPATVPVSRGAWLIVVLTPALLTPLLLRVLPTSFLPILLGDYLLLHFALYGLLTVAGIVWLIRRAAIAAPQPPRISAAGAIAATAIVVWPVLALGLPIDRWLFNLVPAEGRGTLIALMALGTLLWFAADEWLTRNPAAPRFAYPVTKALFLVSLAIAVALDLSRLFFLIIIIPAILLLFIVFGLFSRWSWHATGSPWPAALSGALAFAWGIAVTFPAVAR